MSDPEPPDVGHMRLWSRILPDLKSGPYQVQIDQEVDGNDPDGATVYIDVTGPRFSLPGPEIHSVFPPPNAQGSFSSRLPHIALKRRTLPWEREADPDQTDEKIPWLAVVVLADYEGELKRDQPIREAFTSTEVADRIRAPAEGTCNHLETTAAVVEKVFPAAVELPLLTHVRQVNLQDAENLKGDKDGWMAVCISNRLPQPETTYGAYLISLEGQLEELPEPGDVQGEVGNVYVYQELASELNALRATGAGSGAAVEDAATAISAGPTAQAAFAEINLRHGAQAADLPGRSAWSLAQGPTGEQQHVVASYGAFAHGAFHLNDIEVDFYDPGARKLRFPVLAHWSFRTEGAADFQNLMTNIDIGMLGTRPQPDQQTGDPVEVAETGHTRIVHTTRRGEDTTAWYRGPLTPREVERRDDPAPFFVSGQALNVGLDGQLDVSEAAAFEIGKLLALSDAAFVELLIEWRRSGFQVARDAAVGGFDENVLAAVKDDLAAGRLLGFGQLQDLATKSGLLGPLVNPVRHAEQLDPTADIAALARGLGAERNAVAEAIRPGIALGGIPPDDERGGAQSFDDVVAGADRELQGLRQKLATDAETLARQVEPLGGQVPPIGRRNGEG